MSKSKSRIKTKSDKTEKSSARIFQGKEEPNKQAVIDAQRISNIDKTIGTSAKDLKDFKAFVEVLNDIEPYWITHYESCYPAILELLKCAGSTAMRFREKYGSKIPSMPEDLFSMPDWITGLEAAIVQLEIPEADSRKNTNAK